ncbi:hypothetical protein FCV25MIE_04644, partial [Fagus crenata]
MTGNRLSGKRGLRQILFMEHCEGWRHSANYVLLILELSQYKYTRLLGTSGTNRDLHIMGFYW